MIIFQHKPVSVTITVSDNAGDVGAAVLDQVAYSIGLHTNDTCHNLKGLQVNECSHNNSCLAGNVFVNKNNNMSRFLAGIPKKYLKSNFEIFIKPIVFITCVISSSVLLDMLLISNLFFE